VCEREGERREREERERGERRERERGERERGLYVHAVCVLKRVPTPNP